MTLKQLEAFYWAASCANFAMAAERVHLSISSLSKRIVELEDSLGHPLFDRSGHRATLTDAGHRLLPQAAQLLESAAKIQASLSQKIGLSGRCVFGVGELSALTWLPEFVSASREQFPDLKLEPYVDIGAVLEERMDRGELDFAVIAGRSSRQNILSHPLTEARFVWVASSELVGNAQMMTSALLKRLPLITLPHGAGTTRILDDWLLGQGINSVERIVCNHWGAIAGLLLEGIGVGFLPEELARTLSKRSKLKVLQSRLLLAPLAYSYQWRRHDARPLIGLMRELVVQTASFSSVGQLFGPRESNNRRKK
jgi:DNA-binding transcriptional LysR family regulator